ncbi:MAG: hypothetical protein ABWZ82_08480, partial [Candidatus Limnocylindrales bacterium]
MIRSRAFVLLLGLLLIVVGLPVAASRDQALRPTRVAHQQAGPIPGIDGGDACGMLSDEVLLQATGAAEVVSRVPDTNGFMAASCDFHLAAADDPSNDLLLMLAVQPTGGRSFFDALAEGATVIAGIGDGAIADGSGWSAVKGDTLVMLNYLAFGAPRDPDLASRALIWRIMRDLPDSTAIAAPTAGPTTPPVTAERALVERIRTPEFEADVIDAAIEVLARSGIGTYESPSAIAPVVPVEGIESPVRLLWDQVRAMALEAWANGGIPGEDLDALMPEDAELAEVLPDESPTIPASLVIAGYVADADTEGARIARDLIGEQDWSEPAPIVFPQLVLTLFTSDLARDRMAEAGVAKAAPGAGMLALTAQVRTAQGDLCSSASSFINSALTRVFDALRLDESGGGSIFTTIVNFVVSVAESVVKAIVQAFTQPVLSLIAKIAGMVGVAVSVVSFVRPWSVSIRTDPPVTVKGVGGSPGQDGRITARIELGGLDDWPATLKSCAQLIGVTLPNLRPEGAPVAWEPLIQVPSGLVAPGARGASLDAQGVATWEFRTLVDDVETPWWEREGVIRAKVTIRRPQLESLRSIAVDQLIGGLPDIVQGVIRPWVQDAVREITSGLNDLLSKQGSGFGTVIFHESGPSPAPDEGPTLPRIVWVHYDREAVGDVILAGRILELVSCSGPYGDWSGTMLTGGIGPIPFSELPVEFGFPGATGVQTYTTETGGQIPWDLPGITSNVHFVLRFSVDGSTMRVRITGTVDERVQGQQLLGEVTETSEIVMPIEPAPESVCPPEPTPTPTPTPAPTEEPDLPDPSTPPPVIGGA